ncbi:DUF6894 family protein [Ensifer canadensis]
MQRYLFHIHLAGVTSRDKVGTLLANDSQAVEHGRLVADEIAEEDDYRGVIVAVENAEGRLLARLTASRAMPPLADREIEVRACLGGNENRFQ